MKIIVPIKQASSVERLIEYGADEFYGSFVDTDWQQQYGQYIEYNRRGNYGTKANCTTEKEFYTMVETCRKRQVPFYMTVNGLKITDAQRLFIRPMLKRFRDSGGSGVIFTDLSLFQDIREYGLKPVLSSCAEVINHYMADFYKEIGCSRIILPRDITLKEIRSVIRQVPEIEYEIFFMNSGCRFTDGNCLGLHATRSGALCEYCDAGPEIFYRRDSRRMTPREIELLESNSIDFGKLWAKTCACCNLYDVRDLVHSLKIVERVASEEKIAAQLKMAKKNVTIAEHSSSRREYLERMLYPESKEIFCNDYMNCYYRTDMKEEKQFQEKLQQNYRKFLNHFPQEGLKEKTEYVGVNLSVDSGEKKVDFKLYFNTKASLSEHHPIVDALDERKMLRAVTRIHDTVHGNCERFDLGLARRTKENMTHFFDIMASHSAVMKEHMDEICRLNKMKISDKPEDAHAALYFFGFLEKGGSIEAVKTHFLTRFCRDVDAVDTKDEYRDEYYFDFLMNCGIPEFQQIVPLVRQVLVYSGGHLWMVGADYFQKGPVKYKLYVKKRGFSLYEGLRQAIRESGIPGRDVLIDGLESLECWQAVHSELECDGIAVSLDGNGKWSLNFYNLWR